VRKYNKFIRGDTVKICKILPNYMDHFESNKLAIVSRSDKKQYVLVILHPKPHYIAWYEEDQLILIDDNRDKGEKVLQEFENRE
jgi:hypothetical protein